MSVRERHDPDPFDLERFVRAQAGIYTSALEELREGRKHGHWMWFIFPQLHGLGHSFMATKYAIGGLEEAQQYMRHEILGARLVECTDAVLDSPATGAAEVFGPIDSLKFRSCMTLFEAVAPGMAFSRALDELCDGVRDDRTLAMLGA